MNHRICRISSVERAGPYVLRIRFDDNSERTIDFESVLCGDIYGPLRDEAEFGQFTIDPEVQTLTWPSGADFDPATLHEWPEHEAAFRAAAERWSAIAATTR